MEMYIKRIKARTLRVLGVQFDDSSTIPNLAVKQGLKLMGINSSSKEFMLIKRMYRKSGSHIRIQRSCSFNGEDLILARYLPELMGHYLDIGSGDPKLGSNTYLFYSRGWSGITIDPLENSFHKHRFKRGRDRQILGVVTSNDAAGGKVIFYEYSANDFSTTSEGRYLQLKKEGTCPIKIREVAPIKLEELELSAGPLEPYLLDIDIEGNEFEILQSNNWEIFLPRVIAVEEWESPIYQPTAVRSLLEGQGYVLSSRAAVTSIYVHEAYLKNLESLKNAD